MNTNMPTNRAWSWRSPVGPLTTVPVLVLFAIGLLVPEDILDTSPVAAWVARVVQRTLLEISTFADLGRFARSTEYPQVALLLASLHWMFLPVHVFGMIAITELGIRQNRWEFWKATRGGQGRVGIADLKIVFIGVPLFVGVLIVMTMIPGDWSALGGGLTTRSRLGMSMTFLVGFWIAALVCNGAYAIIRAFIDINIRGK